LDLNVRWKLETSLNRLSKHIWEIDLSVLTNSLMGKSIL